MNSFLFDLSFEVRYTSQPGVICENMIDNDDNAEQKNGGEHWLA
jgi:hypothetical protein